jgi:hypothetical protein
MNIGDHVTVNFISESRTSFDGTHFTGNGTIDRIEDNRVFGRLYNDQPFMCDPADVSVNVDIHNLDKYYQLLMSMKLVSQDEINLIKNKCMNDLQLLNMIEFGLFIYAHHQSVIHTMAQSIAISEFKRIQEEFSNGGAFLIDA